VFQLDRIYIRGFSIQSARVQTGNAWHRISDHAALTAQLRSI
jgi:endonuclease/exonuclease/phosphatase family metal-dependent hydrolase